MSGRAPTVYTVPPHEPFVDALAGGILTGRAVPLDPGDPLALSRLTILLPTRRACRALGLAFLRAAPGRALLLPRIRPLGDIDEDELSIGDEDDASLPDAVSPLERRLLLARLIQRLGETPGGAALTGAGSVDQAARLAQALAGLLDEIQIARIDPQGLATLAPEEYAAHWQQVLRFLSLITDRWPAILAERDQTDPWARRNALLEDLAKRWEESPPAHPVIGAGSTGSVPATRDLLAAVARLPQGMVVLPGLDRLADDETWEAIGPTHPQYALKGLLAQIGVARAEVQPWPCGEGTGAGDALPARSRLIADAMRPAETITAWRTRPPQGHEALRGLHRIDCASPQEEAGVIAVIMRRSLETPGRTAALVTTDRALARRVAAELRRWEIAVDDSAGEPLGETAPGALLRLTARTIAEQAAPVPLLAALKHPLAAGGMAPAAWRRAVRAMERAILRGPRPAPGFGGLAAALKGGRCRNQTLARPAREGRRVVRGPHGRAGGSAGRALAGPHRIRGMARGHERRGRPCAALVRRGGRAGGAFRCRSRGVRVRAPSRSARLLSGAARCADGGPRGPPALRPPSPPADLGSLGGPPAARRLHDPGRAQRGRLAAGRRRRSLDEPAHARGLRPAAAGAPHRALRP